MNRSLIEKYAKDADVPGRAIHGLSRQDLHAFPVPGTWSIQQIILHLMDSDVIAACRMKTVIAENKPKIAAYDETLFAKNLHYEKQDAVMACEVFRLNRILTATILRQLPDAAFDRAGVHSERGPLTLGGLIETYTNHLDHHMKFLREKRALLGKPLAW